MILSICSTTLLPNKLEFGALSLPSAFIPSGSKSIIGSLWKINNSKPLSLLNRFYHHLCHQDSINKRHIKIQKSINQSKVDPSPNILISLYFNG